MGLSWIRVIVLAVTVLTVAAVGAEAGRILEADVYRDKLHGMWLGQILGNVAGRPYEQDVRRGGLDVTVDWSFVGTTDPWDGDDDTCFEYLYSRLLLEDPDPTPERIGRQWTDHVPEGAFWWANAQARYLMGDGFIPPDTGSATWNHRWYAIDAQIATESLGAIAPGLRQRASDLVGRFGSVTNDGLAVHAAQFYGAMYAAAAFESDVVRIVESALEVVPRTSRAYQVIEDVRGWHASNPSDWRATQTLLHDTYGADGVGGRYGGTAESTINLGLTTMALLYGNGDFVKTVEIGVLGGYDADCNPATAGGLVGLITGFSGLPSAFTSTASDTYEASRAHPDWLAGLDRLRPIGATGGVVDDWVGVAEAQILLAGGRIEGSGSSRRYLLPGADVVSAPEERPDPTGPRGLVAEILARGGTIVVSASVETHDPTRDEDDLDSIVDGIVDPSFNGHRAYSTYDGNNRQPDGGDWFAIDFGEAVLLDTIVFHEGPEDSNPDRDPHLTPSRGGYFETLFLDVALDGLWTTVGDFSSLLRRYEHYQSHVLTFDPVLCDAFRIRGSAGGLYEFTTVMELEAFGRIPGSAAVPEPGAVVLFLAGVGVGVIVRRRRGERRRRR